MEQSTIKVRHTELWMLFSEISAIYPTYLFVCLRQARHRVGLEHRNVWFLPASSLLRLPTGGKSYAETTILDRKGWWEGERWEWQREINSCWNKNMTCLFDKLLKMFPSPTSTHTHCDYLLLFFLWNLKTLSIIGPWVFILSHQLVLVTLFYSSRCFPITQK